VAIDICGCRRAVDDGVTGRLVPPHDAAALATVVEALVGGRGASGSGRRESGRPGQSRRRCHPTLTGEKAPSSRPGRTRPGGPVRPRNPRNKVNGAARNRNAIGSERREAPPPTSVPPAHDPSGRPRNAPLLQRPPTLGGEAWTSGEAASSLRDLTTMGSGASRTRGRREVGHLASRRSGSISTPSNGSWRRWSARPTRVLSTGTAGLHQALRLLAAGPGSDVIVHTLGLRLNLLSLPLTSVSWRSLPVTYVGPGVRNALLHHPAAVYVARVMTDSVAVVGSAVLGACRAMLVAGRSLDAGRSLCVPAWC